MTHHGSARHARLSLVGTVALVAVAMAGWFVLSWLVVGSSARDAAGEAVGVGFGVLILFSVVGTLRSSSRRDQNSAGNSDDPS
jgi:hypothetical protein